MAILKKIRSATLIEALVATVLIVIVFVVASLILNNLLFNSFSKNTHAVENRITQLAYLGVHQKIELPYHEEFNNWTIELVKESSKGKLWLNSKAVHTSNGKEVIKIRLYEEQ
jgi:hypothetical protein